MSELKAINAYQLTTNTEDSDVYIHNDEFGCGGDLVECYLKSEADKVIAELKEHNENYRFDSNNMLHKIMKQDAELCHHKYKRCLLCAKNHKNLGDLATDTARLIGLNAYKFTKETETACVAYWNRIRDCHYRHHDEWLELAEKFKNKETR